MLVASQRLLEPFMFRAGMIQHHVQHDIDTSFFEFLSQFVKIRHRTEPRINVAIIGNIITVIVLW